MTQAIGRASRKPRMVGFGHLPRLQHYHRKSVPACSNPSLQSSKPSSLQVNPCISPSLPFSGVVRNLNSQPSDLHGSPATSADSKARVHVGHSPRNSRQPVITGLDLYRGGCLTFAPSPPNRVRTATVTWYTCPQGNKLNFNPTVCLS
jgi:hypothetical protein